MRDAKWGMNGVRKKEDTERKKEKEREMHRHRACLLLHGKSNKRQDHCPGGRRFTAPVRGGVEKRKNWNSHTQGKKPCGRLFLRRHARSVCLSAFHCALRSQPVCFLIEMLARGDAWGLESDFLIKSFSAEIRHETTICCRPSHQGDVVFVILSQQLIRGINKTHKHI